MFKRKYKVTFYLKSGNKAIVMCDYYEINEDSENNIFWLDLKTTTSKGIEYSLNPNELECYTIKEGYFW
jgi:hypothetical protein